MHWRRERRSNHEIECDRQPRQQRPSSKQHPPTPAQIDADVAIEPGGVGKAALHPVKPIIEDVMDERDRNSGCRRCGDLKPVAASRKKIREQQKQCSSRQWQKADDCDLHDAIMPAHIEEQRNCQSRQNCRDGDRPGARHGQVLHCLERVRRHSGDVEKLMVPVGQICLRTQQPDDDAQPRKHRQNECRHPLNAAQHRAGVGFEGSNT